MREVREATGETGKVEQMTRRERCPVTHLTYGIVVALRAGGHVKLAVGDQIHVHGDRYWVVTPSGETIAIYPVDDLRSAGYAVTGSAIHRRKGDAAATFWQRGEKS